MGVAAGGTYDVPSVNVMEALGVNATPCKRMFTAPVASVVNGEPEPASVTVTILLSVVVA